MDTIATRCLAMRQTTGMTARAFSEFISISHSIWVEIENNKRPPGAAVHRGLAQRGFSIDWLLTGEGSMLRGQPAHVDEGTHFRMMQLAADLNLAELAANSTLSHFESHERIRISLLKHSAGLTFAELLVETGFDARHLRGFLTRMVDEAIIRLEKGRYRLVENGMRRLFAEEYKAALIDVFQFFGQVVSKRINRGEPDSKVASFDLRAERGQEAETVKSLMAHIRTVIGNLEVSESAPSTRIRIIFASSAEAP